MNMDLSLAVYILLLCILLQRADASTYQGTSPLVKGVVGGLTSLMNIINPPPASKPREYKQPKVSPAQVYEGIKQDFTDGYLFSGAIDCEIYGEECLFTDPTLSFRGLSTFEKNIAAIKPLLDTFIGDSKVDLYSLEMDKSKDRIQATWRMSGQVLLLPWNPRIELTGNTSYTLDTQKDGRIIDYYESWDLDAGMALGQLFRRRSESEA